MFKNSNFKNYFKIKNLKFKIDSSGFLRLTKKSLVMMLVALIIFTGSGLYLLTKPKPASASWFNDNWAYRQAITVTVSSSSSDISSLETLLTIDTTGITDKLQTSCEDLRFTNTNGKLLPYYIDTCSDNSATNKVWVMADLVPKNTATYTLYMYYGNPSAKAASDSTKFRLFNGLVGYWTMNEASWNGTANEVKDSSVNSNFMIAKGTSGTATTTSAKYSNGGSFTRANAHYLCTNGGSGTTCADDNDLDLSSTITVSAWFNVTDKTLAQRIVSKTEGGAYQISLNENIQCTSGTLCFLIYINGAYKQASISTNNISNSIWYHVVGTYDGSNVELYLNGSLQATTSATGSIGATSSPFCVGAESSGANTCDGTYAFGGTIDDTRVYNRALSASDVSQLYQNPGTIASTANSTVKPSTSFATEEKAPSPVAYWKFDDGTGTTAQDSTTNNLDGTLNNTPTWQTEDMCIAGKCLYFDGTNNENVSKSDDGKLDFAAADNFTIGAWVKRNGASSANNFILTKAQTGYTGYKLYQDASGDYCFDVKDGTNTDTACTSAVDFDDNNWHLVQGVKSGTTSITLYIDGKQRAQDAAIAATGTLANTGTFYIGVDLDGTSNEWLGFIDEVKVYPYARSAAQIQADYNARGTLKGLSLSTQGETLKNLSNGLVGYWKMDESSANSCTGGVNDNCDSSGNGNNGAWNGDATNATGKFGNGVTFDGTGDYVSVTNSTSMTSINTAGTIAAWVKLNGVPSSGNFYSVVDVDSTGCTGAARGLVLFVSSTQYFLQHGDGSVCRSAASTTAPATGSWVHLVGIWDSSGAKFYVNSVLEGTSTVRPNYSIAAANTFFGSNDGNNRYINGAIDDVRIYNRALSANEVSQLYNFAPGPRVELKMEEGSGTSTNDSSGNARTGTINGNPIWSQGKYGKGIKMDGTGDNVQVSDF